jgi:hypothetical protein
MSSWNKASCITLIECTAILATARREGFILEISIFMIIFGILNIVLGFGSIPIVYEAWKLQRIIHEQRSVDEHRMDFQPANVQQQIVERLPSFSQLNVQ